MYSAEDMVRYMSMEEKRGVLEAELFALDQLLDEMGPEEDMSQWESLRRYTIVKKKTELLSELNIVILQLNTEE